MKRIDQLELLKLLQRHGVPFAVVGGHAVAFHGYLRATEDVDVVWVRSAESEAALLKALREVNAQWISDEIDPATGIEQTIPVNGAYIRGTRLMMLLTDWGFLDLFDYVPGLPEEDLATLLAQSVERDGVRYASLSWLKRMKQAAGRPKDLDDLKNLG